MKNLYFNYFTLFSIQSIESNVQGLSIQYYFQNLSYSTYSNTVQTLSINQIQTLLDLLIYNFQGSLIAIFLSSFNFLFLQRDKVIIKEFDVYYIETRCPELLFKPNLFGLQVPGIHELTYKSIMKSDIDRRKDLYQNVILSGGTTMFAGMVERFNQELKSLAPQSVKVNTTLQSKFSAWIGGSYLSSFRLFQTMWIIRSEYNEYGSTIVHRKCF